MVLNAGYAIDGRVDGARMQLSVVAARQSSQREGKNTYRGAESTTKADTQRENERWRWKERDGRALRIREANTDVEGASGGRRRERYTRCLAEQEAARGKDIQGRLGDDGGTERKGNVWERKREIPEIAGVSRDESEGGRCVLIGRGRESRRMWEGQNWPSCNTSYRRKQVRMDS